VSCVGGEICTLVLLVYNAHWLSDVFVSIAAWINILSYHFVLFLQSSLYMVHYIYYDGGTQNKATKNVGLFCFESNPLLAMIAHVRHISTTHSLAITHNIEWYRE